MSVAQCARARLEADRPPGLTRRRRQRLLGRPPYSTSYSLTFQKEHAWPFSSRKPTGIYPPSLYTTRILNVIIHYNLNLTNTPLDDDSQSHGTAACGSQSMHAKSSKKFGHLFLWHALLVGNWNTGRNLYASFFCFWGNAGRNLYPTRTVRVGENNRLYSSKS